MVEDESAKSPTTTRIKSENFLSNISYVGISKEDFVFDVYSSITKNLNPFALKRKFSDQNRHEMIYMVWKEYMPSAFYKHVCSKDNFFASER